LCPSPFFALRLSRHATQVVCLGHAAARFSVQWLDFSLLRFMAFASLADAMPQVDWFSFFVILFSFYDFYGTQQQRLTWQHHTASVPL